MTRSNDPPKYHRHDDEEEEEGGESPPIRLRGRKSSSPRNSSESKKKKRKLGSGRSHHHHRHHQHHNDVPQQPHAAAVAAQPPPVAAAAQAASPAEVAAATLLEHFRKILEGEGPHQPDIDAQKARNALEATAGNMQMAAQLYWDDYFASQASDAAAAAPPPPEEAARSDKKMSASQLQEQPDDSDSEEEDDEEEEEDDRDRHPHRKLRRSLDKDFGRAASKDSPQEPGPPQEEDQELGPGEVYAQDHRPHPRQLVQRLADTGESVSVSDDETGCTGVWRIKASVVADQLDEDRQRQRRLPQIAQKIREAAAAVADKVLPKEIPHKGRKRKPRPGEINEEDLEYISDSDWLEEEGASIRSPFELLWGPGDRASTSSSSANENNEGNVVADEEDDDQSSSGSGIPHTWLNASFALSSCGTGLEVKPPKVEDIEFFAWRQQQNQGRSARNGIPPPYHCKATTALLSVVTAMIFTGASIQGKEVNCTSAKKPFLDLTTEERKHEFESRLAEALSSLLFIASKASMERKRRAMKNVKTTKISDVIKKQTMQRRLRLIPTCSWEDDPSAGIPRAPDAPAYRRIQVSTSLTNMHDIRLYVLSSMGAFTARGGVALLLETILRIHGKGVVARMVQRARQDANLPETTTRKCLIGCTCEERQIKMYEEKPLPASVRNDPSKMLDTTPPGHECVSVELLSLLMTGSVHSTWKGWSAPGLDFGFLTKHSGEVGWQLARPEKPVWVLQGDTCYSVLWLEEAKELEPKTVSKFDKPGTVLGLGHWNSWYGQRNKSGMRLIAASTNSSSQPKLLKGFSSEAALKAARGPLDPRNTTELLLQRRRERQANQVSADEHEINEAKEQASRITEEQIESTTPHPEDEKFYPDRYRMWRFDMNEEEEEEDKESTVSGDIQMRGTERWVPYHRLTPRQKLVVEMKLGAKIKSILWTRWPGATIDKFTDGIAPTV